MEAVVFSVKNATFVANALGLVMQKVSLLPEVIANCSIFQPLDFSSIYAKYPNFMYYCVDESTYLYPSTLDGGVAVKNGGYRFSEVRVVDYSVHKNTLLPLSPCLKISDGATGAVEVRIQVEKSVEVSVGAGAGAQVPTFGISALLSRSLSQKGVTYANHACWTSKVASRPILRIQTVESTVQLREWLILKKSAKKGLWKKASHVHLTEQVPVVLCVDETHQPDVCDWPEAAVKAAPM